MCGVVYVCSSDISNTLLRRAHVQVESAGLRRDLHFRILSAIEQLGWIWAHNVSLAQFPIRQQNIFVKRQDLQIKKPHNLRIANTYVLLLHAMVKALQVLEHCLKAVLGHWKTFRKFSFSVFVQFTVMPSIARYSCGSLGTQMKNR